VQDAYAEIARSFGSLSSTLGLKQNSQKAIDYLDLEFTIHTASIEKFPGRYIRVLQGKKKAYTPEIEEFISRLLKKENNTESLLTVIEEYYRFVDKKEKADEINQQIRSRFPKGAWLRKEKLNEFEEEKNLEKKAAIYKDALASLSPKTDEEKMAFDDDFTWEMMEALADSGYYEKLQYYDAKMFTDIERAGVYHEIAGKLIGLNVNDISTDLKTGKFYMDKAFQILNNMKDSTVPNNIRSNFLHVNALILFKQGKVTEAYEIQKKVVDGPCRCKERIRIIHSVWILYPAHERPVKENLPLNPTPTILGSLHCFIRQRTLAEDKSRVNGPEEKSISTLF
jgi:hypothetical protein